MAQFHQLLLAFRGRSVRRGVILPSHKVMVVRRAQRPHRISDKLRVNVVLIQPAEGVDVVNTTAAKKLLCCLPQNIKVNSHVEQESPFLAPRSACGSWVTLLRELCAHRQPDPVGALFSPSFRTESAK